MKLSLGFATLAILTATTSAYRARHPSSQIAEAPPDYFLTATKLGYLVMDHVWDGDTLFLLAARPNDKNTAHWFGMDNKPKSSLITLFGMRSGQPLLRLDLGRFGVWMSHGAITVHGGKVLAFLNCFDSRNPEASAKVPDFTTGRLWSVSKELSAAPQPEIIFAHDIKGWFPSFKEGEIITSPNPVEWGPHMKPRLVWLEGKPTPPKGDRWVQPKWLAQMICLEGPFPRTEKQQILSMVEYEGSTFIRMQGETGLRINQCGIQGVGGSFSASSADVPELNGQGGGFPREYGHDGNGYPLFRRFVRFGKYGSAGTHLFEFEKVQLDKPFNLFVNANDPMNGLDVSRNARKVLSVGEGPIHVVPKDPSQKVRAVWYRSGPEGVSLTLNFLEGEVTLPNSDAPLVVRQDGKTYRMLAIDGPAWKPSPHFKNTPIAILPPKATCLFELFDVHKPFDLLDGSPAEKGRHFIDVDLTKPGASGESFLQKYKKGFEVARTRAACDAWEKKFALNDPDNLLPGLPVKRHQAFLSELQETRLTTRTGFKQGKIGERYAPDIKYYTSSTDSLTVNGQDYTVTKGETNYSSGWKEGIEGYTAIWGVKNGSTSPFVAEVAVTATSTYNPMVKQENMWGGDQRRTRVMQRNTIRLVKRIFLMPGMDFKDQVVVGEEQPNDFKVEVQDFWPVDATWASNFEKAMGTDFKNRASAKALKPLLEKLKQDTIATGPNAWASDIAGRIATADRVIHEADLRDMRRDLDVSVSTTPDFDPDFFSEVMAVVHNRSAYRYEVTLKKPDGNTETLTVEPKGTVTSRAKVQRIAKTDLKAEILDIVAPADRVFVDAPESAAKASTVAPAKKSVGKKK